MNEATVVLSDEDAVLLRGLLWWVLDKPLEEDDGEGMGNSGGHQEDTV